MIVGGILMALTDEDVQAAAGYFFARPCDTFVGDLERRLRRLRGAVPRRDLQLRAPTTSPRRSARSPNTLGFAAPLIAAGLGVALAFRVGLFNIGGRGQMLIACAAAALRRRSTSTCRCSSSCRRARRRASPAVRSGVASSVLLKARTGAHEVILTIMLNYVAFYLVTWMVRTPGLLQRRRDRADPEDAAERTRAVSPSCSGPRPALDCGLHPRDRGHGVRVVAPRALQPRLPPPRGRREPARRARRRHHRAAHVHLRDAVRRRPGRPRRREPDPGHGHDRASTADIDAGIGFDAITVALLGRSRRRGGRSPPASCSARSRRAASRCRRRRASRSTSCSVVQSLIVLFIAAPPLVRTIFFLPSERDRAAEKAAQGASSRPTKKAVSTVTALATAPRPHDDVQLATVKVRHWKRADLARDRHGAARAAVPARAARRRTARSASRATPIVDRSCPTSSCRPRPTAGSCSGCWCC